MDISVENTAGILVVLISSIAVIIWRVWIPNAVKNQFSKKLAEFKRKQDEQLAEYKRKQDEQLETHKRNLLVTSERMKALVLEEVEVIGKIRSLIKQVHRSVARLSVISNSDSEMIDMLIEISNNPDSHYRKISGFSELIDTVWSGAVAHLEFEENISFSEKQHKIMLLIVGEIESLILIIMVYVAIEGGPFLSDRVRQKIGNYLNPVNVILAVVQQSEPGKLDPEFIANRLGSLTDLLKELQDELKEQINSDVL